MENPTSFDLNLAIEQWRENLAHSPALRRENLAELEAHLRDSVVALEMRGLSKEEAFVIAGRRIGKGRALELEFGKVNGRAVWFDRLLWMLIGFQAWMLVSIVFSTTQTIVRGVLGWTLEGKTGVSELGFDLVVILLPPGFLALVLFLGWRLLRRASGKARDVFAGLLLKPLSLALAFFLASVCLRLLADGIFVYWISPVFYRTAGSLDWRLFLASASSLLPHAVGVVILIFTHKRLRCRLA